MPTDKETQQAWEEWKKRVGYKRAQGRLRRALRKNTEYQILKARLDQIRQEVLSTILKS